MPPTYSILSSFRSKVPVGKQAITPLPYYSKNVGFRPGFDTHHAHLPGVLLVKDARDVDLEKDAKHYLYGHEVHNIAVVGTRGTLALPLMSAYHETY